MNKKFYIIAFLVFQMQIFVGCFWFRKGDELTKFQTFQFSLRDPSNFRYFSILFLQGDTFFLKKYSNSKVDTIYYAILPFYGRSNINMFVRKFDSLPIDSMQDFNSSTGRFSLYLNYWDEQHSIYIHNLHPPFIFRTFSNWVDKMIDSLKFDVADTSIEFKEDEKIHQAMGKH